MIIGRHKEQKLLNKAFQSKESELAVVYGRRRVGKTYLIREFFKKKKCMFVHVTGTHKGKLSEQIEYFLEGISKTFFDDAPLQSKTWNEAFKLLHKQIIKHSNKKVVIFLDELPWLATRRSNLLKIIDYYWNHHWSQLNNVILVLCGSSASWLINNVIYNKGGLHNRVTCELCLLPFDLFETREFLKSRSINLNNKHILSLYMALGGIPYYLKYIEPGLTAEENIQQILFDDHAPLKDEFKKLYKSLFDSPEAYLEIVTLLSKNKSGIARSELETHSKLLTNGGRLTKRLQELCDVGFIEEKISWQKKLGEYYKLVDEFSLFYLNWIKPKKIKKFTSKHWVNQSNSQSYKSWAGYAFEGVCIKHAEQIISALNIKAGGTIDSWRYTSKNNDENGAQIDLLIDRNDDAITICEIKFTTDPFSIDKQYAVNLKNKISVFVEKTKTRKQIFLAIISANGLKKTLYATELVNGIVTLDDLFKPA